MSKMFQTRSIGTVHTSAKARLTSVAIRIQIHDTDRHQNLIICSLAHWQPLKIRANPFGSLCTKLLTDRQTNNDNYISSLAEVKMSMLGEQHTRQWQGRVT